MSVCYRKAKKELIALADGYRESEQSWKELLLDCKVRGLEIEPTLAIGDGALGFWKAMRRVWDTTKEQRCFKHVANVPGCALAIDEAFRDAGFPAGVMTTLLAPSR